MNKAIKPVILSLMLSCMMTITPVSAGNQPLMEIALNNLVRAEQALQKAAWNKGGHRVKALHHVRKSIEEVKKAKEFADK